MVTATTAVVTGQAQFLLANLSTRAPPSLAFAQQPANSAAADDHASRHRANRG